MQNAPTKTAQGTDTSQKEKDKSNRSRKKTSKNPELAHRITKTAPTERNGISY